MAGFQAIFVPRGVRFSGTVLVSEHPGFGVGWLPLAPMTQVSISEGSVIAGRYRLDRLLGEGGMGRVWAATHTVTRRAVAIKFLKEVVQHKVEVRQRFLREASAASALRHPNVVEVLDVFDLE